MASQINILEALGRRPLIDFYYSSDYFQSSKEESYISEFMLEDNYVTLKGFDYSNSEMFCLICTPDQEDDHQAVPDDDGKDQDERHDEGRPPPSE